MRVFVLIFFILFFANSCKNRSDRESQDKGTAVDAETLLRINQQLVKDDISRNEAYAKNHGWNYSISGNGIVYEILDHGSGTNGKAGDSVELSYESVLLDGTFCYSSDSNGIKRFVIDYEEVESGLNDISKLFAEGDSARIILPPHLAFGLAGDRKRVPARSSIVYHLRLLKIH